MEDGISRNYLFREDLTLESLYLIIAFPIHRTLCKYASFVNASVSERTLGKLELFMLLIWVIPLIWHYQYVLCTVKALLAVSVHCVGQVCLVLLHSLVTSIKLLISLFSIIQVMSMHSFCIILFACIHKLMSFTERKTFFHAAHLMENVN